jgi:hypothetical protein
LVAHGWAAPPLVDPAPEARPDALSRFVDGLAALPGAEYVLAVDVEGHRVRGEAGGPPGADLAVLDWARRVAAVSHERRRTLEDLVLTTEHAFHVVRLVPLDPGTQDAAAWVSVRLDRARGNLASARRALAGLGAPGASSRPRALPAGSPDSNRPSPPFAPFSPSAPSPRFEPSPQAEPSPSGPVMPSALSGPATGAFPSAMPGPAGGTPARLPELPSPRSAVPDDGRRHAWPRPEDRAAAKARLTREYEVFAPSPRLPWPDVPDRDAAPEHTGAAPAPATMPGPSADAAAADATSERRFPQTIRQASRWRGTLDADPVVEPAASTAWVAPARTTTESAPGPSLPAPRAGSLFTPVAPVPGAWPVPEEDTGEMAAPVGVPGVVRPRPYAPAAAAAFEPWPASGQWPAPEPWPAPVAGPDPEPWSAPLAGPDPGASDDVPDLPRRRPGASLAPELPAAPRSVPTVHPVAASAGTAAFTTEHSVLRRLLDGLRRLT